MVRKSVKKTQITQVREKRLFKMTKYHCKSCVQRINKYNKKIRLTLHISYYAHSLDNEQVTKGRRFITPAT